jgi:phenylpropionate dioxygenase-like ring-hydroxylating dioxygenase large terminal subunit
MGELFRRFWLPVALSEELPGPDCIPQRLQVMNENLIAFRDTNGRVGILKAYCPHRGAPLFFGRNEEEGLRCVYHGWKFDASGVCVDIPNALEGDTYREKIPVHGYPVVEAGDLVWAYMGPADKKPPFPDFEWCKLPKSHRYVTKFRLECNYLQAMEGDYDVSHVPFLHSSFLPRQERSADQGAQYRTPAVRTYGNSNPDEPFPRAVGDRRVRRRGGGGGNQGLQEFESAALSVSVNEQPDGRYAASVGVTWWMPIFCTAGNALPGHLSSNMRIPIDNSSLMFYRLRWSWDPISDDDRDEYKHGEWTHPALIPGTWTPRDNVHNDYNVDRLAQRYYSYTGIKTFPLQDIAMMENQWGPIADRTLEHLTSSDSSIIYIRKRLLKAANDLAAGVEPPGPWHPEVYRMHRETATASSREEALALAREKALKPLLPERLPKVAQALEAVAGS